MSIRRSAALAITVVIAALAAIGAPLAAAADPPELITPTLVVVGSPGGTMVVGSVAPGYTIGMKGTPEGGNLTGTYVFIDEFADIELTTGAFGSGLNFLSFDVPDLTNRAGSFTRSLSFIPAAGSPYAPLTAAFTWTVTPGPAASIVASPATAKIGEPVPIATTVTDAWGNVIDDADVTLTSSTGTITGQAASFPTAGSHQVTASLTGDPTISTTANVDVSLWTAIVSVVGGDATITAGQTSPTWTIDVARAVDGPLLAGVVLLAEPTGSSGYGPSFANIPSISTGRLGLPYTVAGEYQRTASFLPIDGSPYAAQEQTFTIHVLPAAPDSVTLAPANSTVTAGDTVTFAAIVEDAYGNATQTPVALTTPHGSVDGMAVTFTAAGEHTVTATSSGPPGVSTTATVTVLAGVVTSIDLDSPDGTDIGAGGALDFVVTGADEYGNPIDIDPDDVTITSDQPTDTIDGMEAIFTAAGQRTITATLRGSPGITANETITVIAGTVDSIDLDSPDGTSVDAGGSLEFIVTGTDEYGNPVDIDPDDVTITSDQPTDTIDGMDATFTAAGQRTITATLHDSPGIAANETITVIAGPVDSIDLESADGTTVDQGDSLAFVVAGADEYGNPVAIDPDDVTLVSDQPTDQIDGLTIAFPHASQHVITAIVGEIVAVIVIEVVPTPVVVPDPPVVPKPRTAPATAPLQGTGWDGAGIGAVGGVLLLLGALVLLATRPRGAVTRSGSPE
jgi:plastocyanin